ncbi:MAG: 3-hydroxyacyl-ACP dehydratase FabZ [Desulfobacterales bacterium]|jgi:beta-hydroxyacyl-ACP dehydratase FabZ
MKDYPIQKIMAYLPHRYPFLLVDRVLEIVPREFIVALKNVTINEPFFQGHFPGNPIMPGVLIVEALAQAGGILAYESLPPERRGQEVYFMGFNNVKFRKPVVPGDQLIFRVNFLRQRGNAFKMAGRAEVAETLVAEAECLASFGEKA